MMIGNEKRHFLKIKLSNISDKKMLAILCLLDVELLQVKRNLTRVKRSNLSKKRIRKKYLTFFEASHLQLWRASVMIFFGTFFLGLERRKHKIKNCKNSVTFKDKFSF